MPKRQRGDSPSAPKSKHARVALPVRAKAPNVPSPQRREAPKPLQRAGRAENRVSSSGDDAGDEATSDASPQRRDMVKAVQSGGDADSEDEYEEWSGFEAENDADTYSEASNDTIKPRNEEGSDDDISEPESEEDDNARFSKAGSIVGFMSPSKESVGSFDRSAEAKAAIARAWGNECVSKLLDDALIPKENVRNDLGVMGLQNLVINRWDRQVITELGSLATTAKLDEANSAMLEVYERRVSGQKGPRTGLRRGDAVAAEAEIKVKRNNASKPAVVARRRAHAHDHQAAVYRPLDRSGNEIL
ncbi:hypothetical protein LTR56_018365 [Elasticomyces elasticus]|nr:hypothetical protein LTR56_018365 [Elasticomyces elasticus]KAK3637290.1 hypothetical protein LTR22_018324 [Elasticomyces elasticus]KAK4916438.1 hypothetical protein LTR49_015536 [Elasticomyces elasticus]KAK5756016.1 hypothetical protein LTS12_013905 [Elasticomyces elasticus]